ncbi:IclR family transcriptional regulator C-terminal domain-containing protein [Pseudomonas jessenii]|uniref:IclR family transcriptional regulator C-terminal domain-containing protein n=1 Tax=Pseudomonas jessenii TaxID=77298 RepID=UPI001F4D57ED|nr:IclR family transcriptional regulator C-terminal domain-containing protein [Pseudomonas jessenii]
MSIIMLRREAPLRMPCQIAKLLKILNHKRCVSVSLHHPVRHVADFRYEDHQGSNTHCADGPEITDRRRLLAELQITRARGYAIEDEGIVLGGRCVAAAIRDNSGKVYGALSVAGPAYRLMLEHLELLGP